MSASITSLGQAVIPLKEIPKYLPKLNGKKIHLSTVFRWAIKGTRGRVLATHRVGRVRYTALAALKEFLGPTRFIDVVINMMAARHH